VSDTQPRELRRQEKHQQAQQLREEARQRADRLMSRTWPTWRNRAHRRPLVVAFTLLVLALIGGTLFLEHSTWMWLAWLVGMLVSAPAWAVLRVLTRGVAEKPASALDERDQVLRDRTVYWAYQVTLGSIALVALYLLTHFHQPVPSDRAGLLLLVLMYAGKAAPTMLLAWVLPDDDPADWAAA
jgi:hypothetical protein